MPKARLRVFLALAMLFIVNTVCAQQIILEDNFEDQRITAYWDLGGNAQFEEDEFFVKRNKRIIASFDTTGMTALELAFDAKVENLIGNESGRLSYSIDGTSWITLADFENTDWDTFTYTFPTAVLDQPNFRIRLKNRGDDDTERLFLANLFLTATGDINVPRVISANHFGSAPLDPAWSTTGNVVAATRKVNIKGGSSIERDIDTTGYQDLVVRLNVKTKNLISTETGEVQISVDNGATWENLLTTQDASWTSYTLPLPVSVEANNGFRVRLSSLGDINQEKLKVDYLVVFGMPVDPNTGGGDPLDPNYAAAQYTYNAFGERVIKQVGSETIHYTYDTSGNLIAESKADGTVLREYIYVNGERVSFVRYDENGENPQDFYIHNDHLGTARVVTDKDKTVVWEAVRRPFGAVILASTNSEEFDARFPGQYRDDETGYFYNYFRDYDPEIGRYIESDPIGLGDGVNTYAYTKNEPVIFYDRFGKTRFSVKYDFVTTAGIIAFGGSYGEMTIKDLDHGETCKFRIICAGPYMGASFSKKKIKLGNVDFNEQDFQEEFFKTPNECDRCEDLEGIGTRLLIEFEIAGFDLSPYDKTQFGNGIMVPQKQNGTGDATDFSVGGGTLMCHLKKIG